MGRNMLIESTFYEWKIVSRVRRYAVINQTYSEIIKIIEVHEYDAETGEGQQRFAKEAHFRKLAKAMLDGTFTPTPIAASLDKYYQEKATIDKYTGTFSVEVEEGRKIPQTDGGHRFRAIKYLRDRYVEEADSDKEGASEIASDIVDAIDRLPITCLLYLDGNPQEDFVNLQAGRPVDKTQILSMRIQRNLMDEGYRWAFDCARLLNKDNNSPFFEKIRLDSRANLPLPLATIMSKSSSDLSSSLVGLAKVCKPSEWKPQQAVMLFVQVYSKLRTDYPEVLEYGKLLTPIGQGGPKGAATLMVGVVVLFAHRLILEGKSKALKADLEKIVSAVEVTMDEPVGGNLNSTRKRVALLGLGQEYFQDMKDVEFYQGMPRPLFDLLPASSYGVKPPEDEQPEDVTYDNSDIEPDPPHED